MSEKYRYRVNRLKNVDVEYGINEIKDSFRLILFRVGIIIFTVIVLDLVT